MKNMVEIRNMAKTGVKPASTREFGLLIAQRACSQMGWQLLRTASAAETFFQVCMNDPMD